MLGHAQDQPIAEYIISPQAPTRIAKTGGLLAIGVLLTVTAGCASPAAPGRDWRVTGGDPGNTRYSSLDQINRANVAQLRLAWTYHTGDMPVSPGSSSQIQATPIVVDGVLYTTTPALAVIALHA
ncbi:MAG TPA: hypothetical protein VGR24_03070, partial [bacterium]|nr:hypothetical protein [bacterium]